MTFCNDDCATMSCYKNKQIALNELSKMKDDFKLPLALASFKDTVYCQGYTPLAEMFGIKEKDK